jgi:hypothetical protein
MALAQLDAPTTSRGSIAAAVNATRVQVATVMETCR